MEPLNINIDDFDYPLPQGRIAAHPLAERDQCKLLHLGPNAPQPKEHVFAELPQLLPVDALLVYNNTRVINARLKMRKETGASIEIFCLEPHLPADYALNFASINRTQWLCFVGNSKKWKDGDLELPLSSLNTILKARRISKVGNASIIEFEWDSPDAEHPITFASIIDAAGVIPVPPYLNRETEESDKEDYQTVYSRIQGSVAAPTAGLHFTDELLDKIDQKGIQRRELTLHVGAGTFQPVKENNVANHEMHSEFISVSLDLIEELAATSRKIYAVGTTSVRTLESLYHIGCLIHDDQWTGEVPQWYPYSDTHPRLKKTEALKAVANWVKEQGLNALLASTRIIIAPGYRYELIDGMITNFHQPRSTLLLLVSAFIGDKWREAYQMALDNGFRFLSYGDACLFEK